MHIKADFNFCDLQLGTKDIESVGSYFALHNDLMEHLWWLKGQHRS